MNQPLQNWHSKKCQIEMIVLILGWFDLSPKIRIRSYNSHVYVLKSLRICHTRTYKWHVQVKLGLMVKFEGVKEIKEDFK